LALPRKPAGLKRGRRAAVRHGREERPDVPASPHEGLAVKDAARPQKGRARPMPAPCGAAKVYFPSGHGGGGTMQVSLVLHGEMRDE